MSHEVPAGAIQEGDDYYMVPVGTDRGWMRSVLAVVG